MSGYCKWCDTLTDDIVQDFDYKTGMLVWSGCLSCKLKRIKTKRKPLKKEKPRVEVREGVTFEEAHKEALELGKTREESR
jgi:hypothetical protein